MNQNILALLEQLLAASQTGINYATNDYDNSRYNEIKTLTSQLLLHIDKFPTTRVNAYDKQGYVTPKVGVTGYIVNEKNEILMERRMDDKCWGLPGGWAEVGLYAEDNIKKEILEETGYVVKVDKLLTVMSRVPSEHYPYTSYHLLFGCTVIGGKIKKSYESEEVAWKEFATIDPWHFDHKLWVEKCMSL